VPEEKEKKGIRELEKKETNKTKITK